MLTFSLLAVRAWGLGHPGGLDVSVIVGRPFGCRVIAGRDYESFRFFAVRVCKVRIAFSLNRTCSLFFRPTGPLLLHSENRARRTWCTGLAQGCV